MDNDFRQTDEGGEESLEGDNVVRLPRDWLGPREELIPFGPAAYTAEDERLGESRTPPTARDFWGGDGWASAHEAPQAPPACPDQLTTAGGVRPLTGRGGLFARGRRFPGPRAWRPVPARLLSISVLGLAVTVVLAILVLRGTAQRSADRGLLAAQVAARSGPASAGSQPVHGRSVIALQRPIGHRSGNPSPARNNRRRVDRAEGRSSRRVSASHITPHPVQTPTPAVQPVRYTSPSAEPGGTASSAPSSPPPAPPATVARGGGGQPSGAKQPVWGQNGSLAVGHGNGTG